MQRRFQFLRNALLALTAGLLLPSSLTGPASAAPQGATLRVMTWNIQHAVPNGGGDLAAPHRIADVIRAENPDIVTLNEVHDDEPGAGSHGRQPAQLAALLEDAGYKYTYYAVSEANEPEHPGTRGEMVLSKHRIYTDPRDPRAPEHTVLPTLNADPTGKARRGLLGVTVKVPGIGDVRVYATHLSTPSSESHVEDQKAQVSAILEKIEAVQEPVILAGDFNLRPTDAASGPTANNLLHSLIAGAGLADTWSRVNDSSDGVTRPNSYGRPDGDHPDRRIDYVFVTPAFTPVGGHVSVVDRDASDHLAVVMELQLHRPAPVSHASALAGPEGFSGWGHATTTKNNRILLTACKNLGTIADDGTRVRASLKVGSSGEPLYVVEDGGSSRDRCTTGEWRGKLRDGTTLEACLIRGEDVLGCRSEVLRP